MISSINFYITEDSYLIDAGASNFNADELSAIYMLTLGVGELGDPFEGDLMNPIGNLGVGRITDMVNLF